MTASVLSSGGMPLCAQTTWTPATKDVFPTIQSSVMTPDGFRLEVAAPPGDYMVERSTGMINGSWQEVSPVSPVMGLGDWLDPAALGLPSAFYRISDGFQELDMRVIVFDTMVSSGGYEDGIYAGLYGGLWTGQTQENLLMQSSNGTEGLVKLLNGESAKFRVEPAQSPDFNLVAYMEKWNDVEQEEIQISASSWGFPQAGPGVMLWKLEGGNHSLFGINSDVYEFQETDEFGTYVNTERQVESVFVIAKSTDADPSDLAGSWGFVRLLADAVSSDIYFNGEAWSTTMTAGVNPRPFTVASYTDFEVEHAWPNGDVSFLYQPSVIQDPAGQAALTLAADGSVSIVHDGGPEFTGMVSPSAKLLVASAIDPGAGVIPEGETSAFLWSDEFIGARSEWLVGVKKTSTPELGGKTYRVLRKSWWMEGASHEIDYSGSGDQLVFNAQGTSVTRTFNSLAEMVDFDGVFSQSSSTEPMVMSVSFDGTGKIQLYGNIPGDYTTRAFGYAQEGSNLLIMIETGETVDGAAGVGLIIAVHEP